MRTTATKQRMMLKPRFLFFPEQQCNLVGIEHKRQATKKSEMSCNIYQKPIKVSRGVRMPSPLRSKNMMCCWRTCCERVNVRTSSYARIKNSRTENIKVRTELFFSLGPNLP